MRSILCWVVVAVAACVVFPVSVQAVPVTYNLTFETSGQSLWGSGDALKLDQSAFLGAAWQDQEIKVGGIAFENQTVINPLREAYDIAFGACTALGNSASTCINGRSGRVFVPRLGSRPSVRSCGRFAVACKVKRAADQVKRAAYDLALKTCEKGFSTSVCKNGQSLQLPVIALGTAPRERLPAATGAQIEASVSGRTGVELGIEIDSGSVDATVSYDATLDIPDTVANPGRTIDFNAQSVFAGTNTLDTSFSSIELSLDAIMELSGGVTAEGCVIAAGCKSGTTIIDIAERASILSFNEGGEGGVLVLGQSPSTFGAPAELDGFPFTVDAGGLATVTLHLPQPDASGGLDSATGTLKATGQDDLADLILDVDNIVATAAGLPGLFGRDLPDVEVNGVKVVTASFDIIDLEMGPTIDLKQEFELTPTLFVELVFDKMVEVGGELVSTLVSAWDSLPSITFLDDVTTVTPTFFVEADLENRTLLDFDLEFIIDLLQIEYGFPLLNIEDSFGVGNILSQGVDLFETPDLFKSLFSLAGFTVQLADSFVIDFTSGSRGPQTLQALTAVNPLLLVANPVPAPATILLLLAGMLSLCASRRRSWRAFPRRCELA